MHVPTPNGDESLPEHRSRTEQQHRHRQFRPHRSWFRTRRLKLAAVVTTVPLLAVAGWLIATDRHPDPDSVDVVLARSARDRGAAGAGFEFGIRFRAKVSGLVDGVNFADNGTADGSTASLWTEQGVLVSRAEQSRADGVGWRRADFTTPVAIERDRSYLVSYWSPEGRPRATPSALQDPPTSNDRVRLGRPYLRKGAGFPAYRVRARQILTMPIFRPDDPVVTPTTPAPTTTKPAPIPTPSRSTIPTTAPTGGKSAFPNASNTGVPDGTTLTPYTGPCTITAANTVITGKSITCDLLIKAPGAVIRESRLRGVLDSDSDTAKASVLVEDSEIDGGKAFRATVNSHNVTLRRTEVRGGQHSVQCWNNCVMEDSWLHGQYVPPDEPWHLNAFISNGGTNMTLKHNTLSCDVKINKVDGGCSANASIFGDFEPNSHFTFDNNLFVASTELSYCAYGGYDPAKKYGSKVSNIVFTNNVFQRGTNNKCGLYGPVTSFNSSLSGNVWKNNVWDDGKPVSP